MAKAILEFDLSDTQDEHDYKLATRAPDMYGALCDFATVLRNWCKYGDRNEIPTDEIHAKFYEIINENGVSFEV
jgi:hypothetical protein